MRICGLVIAMLIVAGGRHQADACSCSGPRTTVYPDSGPTNAHVFVWIPDTQFSEHMSPLALRAPGSKVRIEVAETSVVSGEMRIVELAPRAALSPKTAYEIVDVKDVVIGKFTTGDGPRTEKLAWKGVAASEYVQFRNAGGGSCRIHTPFIRLVVPEAGEHSLYAIWVAGKDGKIDYAKAPSVFGSIRGGTKTAGTIYLGRTSICGRDNFTIPRGPRLVLGVKLVGETGATSAASEVTLDLTKPVEIDSY